jgi:hypothetical protein
MALVRSTILSVISGSINGTTFSRNASGAYARNRTVPVNPNTPTQVQARAALSINAVAWKTLTDAQRDTWRDYAQNTPVQNRIGETIHLSGFAWFMKINSFISFIGETVRTTAPTQPGVGGPIVNMGITADISDQEFTVASAEAAPGFDNAAAVWAVWISSPQSAGKTFFKGPWNYAGNEIGSALVGRVFLPSAPIATGQLYFYRARYIDQYGRLSSEWISGPRGVTA